jgi:hypothetical protein
MQGDDYRLQFAFDGGRFPTPWLAILGKRAPQGPVVEVELVRSGDALLAAKAAVRSLHEAQDRDPRISRAAAKHGHQLVAEFANATHWPKHVLVSYSWKTRHEANAERGLLVLLVASAATAALAALGAARRYRNKLRAFFLEVAGEGAGYGDSGRGIGFRGGAKAD